MTVDIEELFHHACQECGTVMLHCSFTEPVVVSVMLLVAWSGGPRLGKGKAYSLISSLVDSCAVPGLLLEVDLGLNWDWRFRLSYHHAAIETSIICSTHVAFN